MRNFITQSLSIVLLLGSFEALSVTSTIARQDSTKNQIDKIEDYILNQKLDSALILINGIESKSSYILSLKRIAQDENLDYQTYLEFCNSIISRESADYRLLNDFIEKNVSPPSNFNEIDMDYVDIKWNQINSTRDQLLSLGEASLQNDILSEYVNRFSQSETEVIKAHLLTSTHEIVMSLIQNKIAKGKSLCLAFEKTARTLNDIDLIILSLNYTCEFLLHEEKLDEFITTGEEAYLLDNKQAEKSPHYSTTLIHLINAYIFKGNQNQKVVNLLNELYDSPSTVQSYSLYAQLLTSLPTDSPLRRRIFEKFEVNNLADFCAKIIALSENKLNLNDFFYVLLESSYALENDEEYKLALGFQKRAIFITRQIYTTELSSKLAEYETNLAKKEKELAINHEKEQSKLYLIIAILMVFLTIAAIFGLIRSRNNAIKLREKNNFITRQNEAITKKDAEKELLLKEVHHRVKNNFQIIMSLMEIQVSNIEDPKSKALSKEGKNRIKSMSLIHEKLYSKESLNILFDEYILNLTNEISKTFDTQVQPDVHTSPSNLSFDIDTAIPLGLIINELVTNTFKYGFGKNEKLLTISISEQSEIGTYQLIVSDNGIISPDFDLATSKNTGLLLVHRLAKQLQGNLEFTKSEGSTFIVNFKNTETRNMLADG